MSRENGTAQLWVYGPDGKPAVSAVSRAKTLVGRGDNCDVQIADEGVSWDHLEIAWHGSALVATDLDSLNGTVLNGKILDRPARLRDGDRIQLGEHLLQVRIAPKPGRGETVKRSSMRVVKLSDEELEIAQALVSPHRSRGALAPATRAQIASELNMSESKVKRRMASMAQKLGLPQHENRDRPRLIAERVIELGLDLRR